MKNIPKGRSLLVTITHLLIDIVISKSVIIHDGFIVTVYIVAMSRGRSVNVVEGARENLPGLTCGMNSGYHFNIPHDKNRGGQTAGWGALRGEDFRGSLAAGLAGKRKGEGRKIKRLSL